jgi:hypothetical protein
VCSNIRETFDGSFPFLFASSIGAPLTVASFFSLCVCVHQDKWTPLHIAALNGHERMCSLLIQRGASLTAKDEVMNYHTEIHSIIEHCVHTSLLSLDIIWFSVVARDASIAKSSI